MLSNNLTAALSSSTLFSGLETGISVAVIGSSNPEPQFLPPPHYPPLLSFPGQQTYWHLISALYHDSPEEYQGCEQH